MRTGFIVLLLALAATAQDWPKPLSGTFVSPDGVLKAEVTAAGERERPESESRVVVSLKDGSFLAKRDLMSADHEHGYGVVQAQWTPDSQYFVFCIDSSGGHSPMQTPVLFYSRKLSKFFVLDDLLRESVGFAHFKLAAPDNVSVTLNSGKKWSGSLAERIRSEK